MARVGNGTDGEFLRIPPEMLLPGKDPKDLIKTIFGDLGNLLSRLDSKQLRQHAILTPYNKDVNELNDTITSMLPGDSHESLSSDSIAEDQPDAALYQVEFLNQLQPSGIAAHKLMLKVGMPIILMRNLNPAAGLANGTRLIITGVGHRLLQARIITAGAHENDDVLLPRIDMSSQETDFPFVLHRRQYAIRPAFAMTINKAQGQTLDRVGVYLPRPVFAHGQLDVAMTRVGQPDALTIMVSHDPLEGAPQDGHVYTSNIVYQEALPPEV